MTDKISPPLSSDELVRALAGLERPARYLGAELGAAPNSRPDARGRLLTVALAFPDIYEIAHGHLGHKILYTMINSVPGFRAERVYAPWTDLAARLAESGAPLRSLESRAPLSSFDMIGFSLQYEMAHTTILDMLALSRIPPLAKDRGPERPLICAGGPGASNPEPLADFLDIVFVGDAEASMMGDLELIKAWRFERAPKEELFERLAGRPGIYIPSLFRPVWRQGALSAIEPLKGGHDRVVRAVVNRLAGAPFPICQIVPLVKPVHDRVVVEIGRGCSRGCRFCQAGYLYRPVRERSAKEALNLVSESLAATGHDQAAFLSLSAGDHTEAAGLVESFMDRYAQESVALSLPSLRVRSLSGHLARQIRRVRKTGFTMAPEAGTERLRAVINKDLTEDDIIKAAEAAFSMGWRSMKLYFMVGLPTETDEDLDSVAELARLLARRYKARLNLGVAHFTPKAHTPFQWMAASNLPAIEARLARVKAAARTPSLVVRYNDPGVSMIEGILSRGDRRLGPLLSEVSRLGGRLEAWSDHFRLDRWTAAMESLGLDFGELARERSVGEVLPWSHIFCGVTETYLAKELDKAKAALPTPDCRLAGCQGCGACHDGVAMDLADPDFWSRTLNAEAAPDETAPVETAAGETTPGEIDSGKSASAEAAPVETAEAKTAGSGPKPEAARPAAKRGPKGGKIRRDPSEGRERQAAGPAHRYLARFRKEGAMVLLGHLEMVEVFKRAFRRAGLALRMSQGFHPQPRLVFLTALPVGLESLDERLFFELSENLDPKGVPDRLILPEGLTVVSVRRLPPVGPKPKVAAALFELESPALAGPPLHPGATLRYTGDKGPPKEYLLSDFVREASLAGPGKVRLAIRVDPAGTPKVLPVARALWGLPEDWTAGCRKIATILETDPA